MTVALPGATGRAPKRSGLTRKPFEKQPLAFVPRIASPGDWRMARAMRLGRGGYGVAAPQEAARLRGTSLEGEKGATDNGRHEREAAPPSALDSHPSRPAAAESLNDPVMVKDHLGLVPHH